MRSFGSLEQKTNKNSFLPESKMAGLEIKRRAQKTARKDSPWISLLSCVACPFWASSSPRAAGGGSSVWRNNLDTNLEREHFRAQHNTTETTLIATAINIVYTFTVYVTGSH